MSNTQSKLIATTIFLVAFLGISASAWLTYSRAADQPSQPEGVKEADLRDSSNTISAPIVYEDLMLVLVTKNGAAAVVFTKEIDGGMEYKSRYESADGKIKLVDLAGSRLKDPGIDPNGKKGELFIEAGPIPLRWSFAGAGKGWIYYDPSVLKVYPAKAADFEDRVDQTPFDGPVKVAKLDLRRFQWK